MPRLLVGHLVGELDKLAVSDGFSHVRPNRGAQKIDAPKILTLPFS
jgi:hypothetical protein